MNDTQEVATPLTERSTTELMEQFENDMIYDAHSLPSRFSRSAAKWELVRRERVVLGDIARHLRAKQPMALRAWAWCRLLNLIEVKVDPDRTAPDSLYDAQGWASWAEKFAT